MEPTQVIEHGKPQHVGDSGSRRGISKLGVPRQAHRNPTKTKSSRTVAEPQHTIHGATSRSSVRLCIVCALERQSNRFEPQRQSMSVSFMGREYQDFYELLGLPKDATTQQIQKGSGQLTLALPPEAGMAHMALCCLVCSLQGQRTQMPPGSSTR